MIDQNTKFRIVYGTEAKINSVGHVEGYVYVASDTNKIFLFADRQLKQIGGSGSGGGGSSSLIWADGSEDAGTIVKVTGDASDGDPYFLFSISALEEQKIPDQDGLILNSDGRFFRVLNNALDENRMFSVLLIAVSGGGSGGGGGGGQSAVDLFLNWENIDLLGSTYIHGQDSKITFIPKSTADEDVSITITAKDLTGNNPDVVRSSRVLSESPVEFNANLLPVSNNIQITVLINSNSAQYNRGKGLTKVFEPIRVLNMYLEKPVGFTMGIQEATAQVAYMPYFTGLGDVTTPVYINYSVDNQDAVVGGQLVAANDKNRQFINIPEQPHGMHTVNLWLTSVINDVEYQSTPVTYEIPWVDTSNDEPIIWIANELGTIIQYEPAVVQYMVYSSVAAREGSPIEVSLYKGGVLLNTEEVSYTPNAWLSMDLTTNYEPGQNNFTISCGSASKRISFYIETSGARDLSLKYEDQLNFNFDSMGRSSKEIKSNRVRWVSKVKPRSQQEYAEAILENFNWYSNGWMNDNDGMGSYLSVANGASVRIPMSTIALNSSTPWTFEIRFRVRNAKKFATLVTDIPKYRYVLNGIESTIGDEKTLDEIEEIGATVMLDEDGNPVMNEANTTKKIVQTDKFIALKYLNSNNEGFAIGTQEAYFNTSGSTVNVKYKEGEIINISFVIDRQSDALSIYLNGILSGVTSLSAIPSITMENVPFLINSQYCDFDLYKFRAYPVALTMPDIIHNYISDIKDINIYDENKLTNINDDTKLDYNALLEYNAAHPDDPTMPYVVIDMTKTSQGTDLPHYKGANREVGITFVNPVADYKLSSGQITAYDYYIHCPSYTAEKVDLNVQGTSSQKYPRRNFKAKFKSAKNTWVFTAGPLQGKPIASNYYFNPDGSWFGTDYPVQADGEEDEAFAARCDAYIASLPNGYKKLGGKWHMDSEKIGVNKFTWKIDYMESSGSYNTGFANLMGSGIYEKHPLEDLHINGVDASIYRTSVYGFPMLAFHKIGENQYVYIGRYNNNLDKSANERYGFEEKIKHPYVTVTKTTVDPDTGIETTTTSNDTIKNVSECWELRDNQGTWCSWRYPTAEMREAGFHAEMVDSTPENPKIEVVQHFEARYHAKADQFEYAQNILLGKENTEDFSADIGGATTAAASAYCYKQLKNLEVLFNWLDSTDTKNATNTAFETPITLEVNAQLEDAEAIEAAGVSYTTQEVGGINKIFGTFTKDSIEYRRQKFYAEFDKHLDKHYCAVYFVMTELMLCYDSRGKNMMIATFGPREQGGDYVWYPIFYDIDTQLGLNNVGAKLWDYDEDCSENGTFSTKDSVLWTNFLDLFKSTIISTYRTLRNGKIDYNTIENSYRCQAGTTFNSYAMQGKRPIIAIGLDEYYKYVLPTKEAWKNQEGNWVTANYLYACQGDRILSRELLINNRLLYMDSKWLGGNFTISTGGMSGLMFRGTGNKPTTSSDKYLDSETLGAGQVYGQYPVPYFDATPEYYVTPYLNFYITTFVDENVFQTAEAYNEAKYPNGIPTVISSSVLEGYRSGDVDQQLNYFAGSKYISSLGDLSTKYINQADIIDTPRLLDITIGSDVPGYFNNETLDPFNLHTEVDINGKVKSGDEKSLLDKIILTNVRGVNKYLDVRSPDKLTEFRALGTNLQYVLFADGAPLRIVHLPNTVTRLVFTQNKDLKKILTSTPVVLDMVNDVAVYRDPSTYEGLYVEDVTDYSGSWGLGSPITELSFEGDALGYGSYQILQTVVKQKNGTGRTNRLSIRMADISWTPYVQVEYGETKMTGTQYYWLTDHSTYEPYNHSDEEWYDDTLNGRVYTYDNTKDESIIQDLSLLQLFLQDKQNAPTGTINQFTNNIESMRNQQSYPTISGEIYISNASGTVIAESDLTSIYAEAWPNLKIRVANVDPAYIAKFIQKLDNGKDSEIDVKRYARNENTHPEISAKRPVKQNHNFRGWTLDPNYVNIADADVASLVSQGIIYVTNEDFQNLTFSEYNDVYTFYAVFSITAYNINFRDPKTDEIIYTYTANYGSYLYDPGIIPTTDESSLTAEERYKFLGWTTTRENNGIVTREKNAKVVTLENIVSQNEDKNYYGAFIKESVYDSATGESNLTKYYNFDPMNYLEEQIPNISYDPVVYNSDYDILDGYRISVKEGIKLNGKVTLPTTYNNKPIVAVYGFYGTNNTGPGTGITHLYWKGDTSNMRYIMDNAFHQCRNMRYFQLPEGLRVIGEQAFYQCDKLATPDFVSTSLVFISNNAFNRALYNEGTESLLHLPGSIKQFGAQSFRYYEYNMGLQTLQIGGPDDPSLLLTFGENAFEQNSTRGRDIHFVRIYQNASSNLGVLQSLIDNITKTEGYDMPEA